MKKLGGKQEGIPCLNCDDQNKEIPHWDQLEELFASEARKSLFTNCKNRPSLFSEGEVRWMEVRDWLKRESDNGKKPVKQIIFKGERFDVMSVRRWRDRVLNAAGGAGNKA